jgi:thiamine biosynthesis lipoprotein
MAATSTDSELAFRAMATDVSLRVVDPGAGAREALRRAEAVFRRVEAACTRFRATSPLMLANADPSRFHDVPAECAWAVEEAIRAHRETNGVFDPRVFDALVDLGYDHSLVFEPAALDRAFGGTEDAELPDTRRPRAPQRTWAARVQHLGDRHRIHLDGARIDLGGIGKGLAVRWAARELIGAGHSALVEAGGDCQLLGSGPSDGGWLVGVEDPHGGSDPLAVLSLRDLGCATSSVRLRRWMVDGHEVHHIIDPRTGRSGGQGLAAVTVIHPDVAWAEVWSKTLFLTGPERIEEVARQRRLAAVWVQVDGTVRLTPQARDRVVWAAAHV